MHYRHQDLSKIAPLRLLDTTGSVPRPRAIGHIDLPQSNHRLPTRVIRPSGAGADGSPASPFGGGWVEMGLVGADTGLSLAQDLAGELERRDPMGGGDEAASVDLGPVAGEFVPAEAGAEVVFEVVVVVQEPPAQPRGQGELPGVVEPARGEVEVLGHDPQVLPEGRHHEREEESPLADRVGQEGQDHPEGGDHGRGFEQVAGQGAAPKGFPGVAVDQGDVGD